MLEVEYTYVVKEGYHAVLPADFHIVDNFNSIHLPSHILLSSLPHLLILNKITFFFTWTGIWKEFFHTYSQKSVIYYKKKFPEMKYKKSLIEDPKEVIKSRKSKKDSGQKKNDKRTNHNLRNTTHKTKDGSEFRCSGFYMIPFSHYIVTCLQLTQALNAIYHHASNAFFSLLLAFGHILS